jgi:uncharacterized protein
MAQPNVAREPSMEEILASIRRIIENNETPDANSVVQEPYIEAEEDEAIQLTVDDVIPDFEVPEFHSENEISHSVAEVRPEMRDEEPRQKPLSLADVAARVRASSNKAPSEPAFLSAGHDHEAEQPQAAVPEPEMSAIQPEAEPSKPEPRDEAPASYASQATSVQPEAEEKPASRGLSVQQPILSFSAGERVSKSFDELASALGASHRSLDEIAEEMLRPLLHDWLDNNLPTLVERLVREEIERVARGPRR